MGGWSRQTIRRCLLALALPVALGAQPAGAQERDAAALRFTVRPSGVDEDETLDQKLARRERGFRFICIGCLNAPGPLDHAPFQPIRTLNSPELTRALGIGEAAPD